ncbi:MAG: fumarylacetoacetate hydrolase family protein [Casimicrobiaceae bacterium]
MNATAAAALLLEARRTGVPIAGLPADAQPATDADSYAIQDAQITELGLIGGWKVGAHTPDSEPNCAPLPASLVVPTPQVFAPDRFPLQLVEAELGFTFARDLPLRATPYVERDVVAAIASVHATIEVLGSRYQDFRSVAAPAVLADFASNGMLVVGEGRTADVRVDQMTLRLQVFCNGKLELTRTGGNTAGDVFRLLTWLANHTARRTGGLRAGMVVTTGSCIGGYPVPPKTHVRAAFDGLPAVEATV